MSGNPLTFDSKISEAIEKSARKLNELVERQIEIQIEVLPSGVGLPIPSYAREGDAGMDLYSASWGSHLLEPGETVLVPCGFKIAIPQGYVGLICPRSGLALKSNVTVLNAPGVVDSFFRGEVGVILYHAPERFESNEPFVFNRGDRIAQMLIAPVMRATLVVTEKLDDTERNTGGFGSTGQ